MSCKIKFPKTYDFFKQFETAIRKCALLAQFFDPDIDPFYSSYNVGTYTFAPFKVVWKEICAEIEAVVVEISKDAVIPDHKLVMVAFYSADPAYFLSGMLNSAPIALFVRSYALQTSISGHIFDYVAVPEYDQNKSSHGKIARLSRLCHDAKSSGNYDQLEKLEAELDLTAAEVLNVSTENLKVIQGELQELRGSVPASEQEEE